MKPIYQAPSIEKLKDLQHACQIGIDCLEAGLVRDDTDEDRERYCLKPGEFAICDWIVRPRFPEKED